MDFSSQVCVEFMCITYPYISIGSEDIITSILQQLFRMVLLDWLFGLIATRNPVFNMSDALEEKKKEKKYHLSALCPANELDQDFWSCNFSTSLLLVLFGFFWFGCSGCLQPEILWSTWLCVRGGDSDRYKEGEEGGGE